MLKRQFRTYTKKASRTSCHNNSKTMSKVTSTTENHFEYQKLSFKEIQSITRTVMKDPRSHENNMGVISSIKGKMYCLKLGEVGQPKDFSHYFYFSQHRNRLQQAEPLKKLESNEYFKTTIEKF